jgi:hypothetical protein
MPIAYCGFIVTPADIFDKDFKVVVACRMFTKTDTLINIGGMYLFNSIYILLEYRATFEGAISYPQARRLFPHL